MNKRQNKRVVTKMDGQEKRGTSPTAIAKSPKQVMIDATEEFAGEGGALENLIAASNKLKDLGHRYAYDADGNLRMESHRPEMSAKEAYDMLFRSFGITGERGNGVVIVDTFYKMAGAEGCVEKYMPQIVRCFFGNSQMTTLRLKGAASDQSAIPEKAGIVRENSLEAMDRCGNEVFVWVHENGKKGHISPEGEYEFASAIFQYIEAMKGVHKYAKQVHTYTQMQATTTGTGGPSL